MESVGEICRHESGIGLSAVSECKENVGSS